MDKAQFEALLDRYNLPKEAAWDSLKEGVRFHKMVLDMKTSEEDSLQVWGQDSEELIRLIKAVEGAATIKVLPDNGRGVTIEDKPLLHYLLLSLHKLLYLRWGFDSEPTEEETKEGRRWLLVDGYKEPAKVGIKQPLAGEKEGFIQPFNEEELDILLRVSCWIKEAQRIVKGKGKNLAALGDAVVSIKADCPPEVLKLCRTDLLNFIADLMYYEGFFEGAPKAQALSKELEEDLQSPYKTTYGLRNARQRMLSDWIVAAKKVKMKTTCKDCSQCAKNKVCPVSKNLKQYDFIKGHK